jgi:hypothetical protein
VVLLDERLTLAVAAGVVLIAIGAAGHWTAMARARSVRSSVA